ncbi:MAG: DNA replication/repair protein RecF [Anaerolineae bacterium]|nr:DNA replication/repair protein RecF [Anaerolineae bacterium]
MRLNHLTLHNFRNYVRLEIDLSPGVTLLAGDNAQGKTNLLESVYYLATSRSPHAGSDREVVNWLAVEQEPLPYARLVGHVTRTTGMVSIEITLTQQANNGSRYKKEIRINGVARRAMDMLGQLNVVLFLPEDLTLVSGSPGGRRRYLDVTLCQIDATYCRLLSRYNNILTQRNALLRDLRERGRNDAEQLAFWDERLVESGAYLVARRQCAVQMLDTLANLVHSDLTAGLEALHLRYEPSLDLDGLDLDGHAVEAIAGSFHTQVRAQRSREVAAGVTLVGPHRDEMRFLVNDVDAGIYGSRGQQRTAALALKLAEVRLMRQETGEEPVLLLDDVLSELDAHRRAFLLRSLASGVQQSVITTTDLAVVPGAFRDQCQVWRVEAGRLLV